MFTKVILAEDTNLKKLREVILQKGMVFLEMEEYQKFDRLIDVALEIDDKVLLEHIAEVLEKRVKVAKCYMKLLERITERKDVK